jgi:branched-chain amino acid transport system substrate-binding protein
MVMSVRIARRTFVAAAAALALCAAWPAAAQQKPVKIGSILSVTGPAAFLGEDMKAAMEMAIDEINAKGGINGRKIDWVFYDAESQTQKGLNATRRLMTQDNVDMIVGGGNMSGMALAMLQLTEKAPLLFLSTEGSMQIVNPVAERQWTFKSTADDDQVMERLADFFQKNRMTKVAMLADSSGFGQSAVEQMKKVAAARKLDVIYESFNPSDTDMTPQLTKLKAQNPQAIICWTVTPAGVVFLKQAKALGVNSQLIHSYGFVDGRYMELAGDAAKGLLLVSQKFIVGHDLPDSDPAKQKILDVTRNFVLRHKRQPNVFAGQTYDAIYLAKAAIEKGGTDKAKVRDGMRQIRGFQGVGGVFNFSPERHSGLSKNDLVLVKWEGGRFRLADYK